jgi:starch phosphorylase
MDAQFGIWLRKTDIAYFTMEIALEAGIHTYSGGLGVLAGDTARSAADLNLPIVFVSLVSDNGYLRQEIRNGSQIDLPHPWDPSQHCGSLDAMVAIRLEGRRVWIRPWLHAVTGVSGHAVPVVLLDTDLDQNDPLDRPITDRLYGGDVRNRLRQEAVLGIGGPRVLQALGFEIGTYHLNEGHAALLTLELLRRFPHQRNHRMANPPLYDEDRVLERLLFTTHTPVEAGHDKFSYDLLMSVLGDFIEQEEIKRYAGASECNLTRLALNLSGYVNGVARRHARTTQQLFPGYSVSAITNGIHAGTWAHPALAELFQARLPDWSVEPDLLVAADQIDDEALSAAKRTAKAELIGLVRESTGRQLSIDRPIIAFARRMTGYKRPALILSDLERLKAIASKWPFQIVWSGKAHPADLEGKNIIRGIHDAIKTLGDDVLSAFLADYGTQIARIMVAGADIWLNTPRPPMEASGTSGMKAALNGTLNLSVLDGWWIEAWIEDVTGWSIGDDVPGSDADHAASLYDKLENKILPTFVRDRPRWLWMMKQSISKIGSRFNSQRMMRRYTTDAYLR